MNYSIKNDLIAAIEDKNEKVVFICGSGIALGATGNKPEMGWGGLLRNGLRYAKEYMSMDAELVEQYEELLNTGGLDDWINVAENVEQKLGRRFGEWLKRVFGSVTIEDPTVLYELMQFTENLGCVIATTNYDDLLERTTRYRPITCKDPIGKTTEILKGNDKGILHLHGYWDVPESVVLGLRSYERVKKDEKAQLVLKIMSTMTTMVFVGSGSGLEDPNIGAFLEWAAADDMFKDSKPRIYVLACAEESEEIYETYPPDKYHIDVINYGEKYDKLGSFLKSLSSANITTNSRTGERIQSTVGHKDSQLFDSIDNETKSELSFNQLKYDFGLLAIHMSVGDESIFKMMGDSHCIDIMSNTAKGLIHRYSRRIANAIAIHGCRVRLLISNPQNSFWNEEIIKNGLCPNINIIGEIEDVINMLKDIVDELKQHEPSPKAGSLEVKMYSNVPTCSIIIVNNEIARFTSYLPFVHSTEVPIYDVKNDGAAILFTVFQETFDRVWKKSSMTVLKEDFAY